MTQRGISRMPYPLDRYRPDISSYSDGRCKFETEEFSRKEDGVRVKSLRKAALKATKPDNQKAALELADRLTYGYGEPPETLASHLYMRGLRIPVAGGLTELAELEEFGQPSTAAISPRTLEIPGPTLRNFDPRKACAVLRADLYASGARYADGYFAGFMDGEHEPETDVFRIHFHALVAGGMLDVVDRLRTIKKYQSVERRAGHRKLVPRIVVSRKPLTNMPAPVTYLLKSFWSERWEGQIGGEAKRQNFKSRIGEPRHSQVLIWLDRSKLEDLTVLIGLRVHSDGFRLTKSKLYTNGEGK